MTFRFGETVIIRSPGPRYDRTSTETVYDDWDNVTDVTADNVLVGSGGSTEPTEAARNAVDSDFDLIFQPPYTSLPTPHDRVVVRGMECDVDGRGFEWRWGASPGVAGTVFRASIKEG